MTETGSQAPDFRRRGRVRWPTVAVAGGLAAALVISACAGEDKTPATPESPRSSPSAPLTDTTPKDPASFVGPVRRIEANGIEIGYRQFGEGKPLLLIMGWSGTMNLWEYTFLQKLVDAGFKVTAFDNRGMGYTTDDLSGPLTMELMARDAISLVDELGLEKPTVVGWSMGGEIALTIATSTDADKVGTIITCGSDAGSPNSVPPAPEVEAETDDPNISTETLLGLLFPADAQAAIDAFIASVQLYPPETASPESIQRQSEAEDTYAKSDAVWDGLERVRNKVVLVTGSEDVMVPPENAHLAAARIKGSVVEVFEGAGHAALMQDPDRFVEIVKKHA